MKVLSETCEYRKDPIWGTKTMSEEEIVGFLKILNHQELRNEMEDIASEYYPMVNPHAPHPYPRFLTGIFTTLVHFGYDRKWVYGELKKSVDEKWRM